MHRWFSIFDIFLQVDTILNTNCDKLHTVHSGQWWPSWLCWERRWVGGRGALSLSCTLWVHLGNALSPMHPMRFIGEGNKYNHTLYVGSSMTTIQTCIQNIPTQNRRQMGIVLLTLIWLLLIVHQPHIHPTPPSFPSLPSLFPSPPSHPCSHLLFFFSHILRSRCLKVEAGALSFLNQIFFFVLLSLLHIFFVLVHFHHSFVQVLVVKLNLE